MLRLRCCDTNRSGARLGRSIVAAPAVAVCTLLAGIGAGCGSDASTRSHHPPDRTTPSTVPAAPCGEDAAKPISFGAGAYRIDGGLVGNGRVGAVLSHQFGGDLCDLVELAKELGRRRMLALIFTFSGRERLDRDVVAAALELQRRGTEQVFLVGSSMGAIASLTAAPDVPNLAGVVSISGPLRFQGLRALSATQRLRVPLLFLAARGDGSFARQAKKLYDAAPSREKRLVITEHFEHGVDLLQDPEARQGLFAFVDEHAG